MKRRGLSSSPFSLCKDMIEKLQDWLLEQDIHDLAYWLTIIVYTSIMIATLAVNGYVFNNWTMIIVGTIVMNMLRMYSGGYHCTSLVKCILFTNLLFVIFGFAAKLMPNSLTYIFTIASILWIVYRTPVIETNFQDMPARWHKAQVADWCAIFLVLSIIIEVIGFVLVSRSILWSIILVAFLCFKNPIATSD